MASPLRTSASDAPADTAAAAAHSAFMTLWRPASGNRTAVSFLLGYIDDRTVVTWT